MLVYSKWTQICCALLMKKFDYFQELIGQLYQDVTEEYVKRLLRGDVKLKDKEQQQKACITVMDNAESLHMLFSTMVSKHWNLAQYTNKPINQNH